MYTIIINCYYYCYYENEINNEGVEGETEEVPVEASGGGD